MKHANAYKYTNKERLFTSDLWSQARKVWKNNEAAETGLEGSTEAEASWRPTVWSWGIERTFAAAIDFGRTRRICFWRKFFMWTKRRFAEQSSGLGR